MIIALLTVVLLVFSILSGFHVGVSLLSISFGAIWLITGNFNVALKLLGITSFASIVEYVLAVVPMFILMGLFANLSGASNSVYDSANMILGRIRGGLGIATVLANAIFAAITGSSLASAAVFSKIAYPQMTRLGYDKRLTLGTIVGSSVLGMLIPPSLLLIIYGYLTEVSVGKLFIAGIIPGILLTVVYSFGIWLMVTVKPELAGKSETSNSMSLGMKIRFFLRPWFFGVLIFLVLGGIYLGWFTPTEAGAVGAFGSFAYGLVIRKIDLTSLWALLVDTGETMGSLFFIFIGAQFYSRMLSLSRLPITIVDYISALDISAGWIVFLFILVYLILGALLDSISILLITTPIIFPIIVNLGLNPIWFAIVACIAIEMGLLTPPFGVCIFVLKSALGDEVTVMDGFAGAVPFLFMMAITLVIICAFPILSTWLPGLM